MITVLAGGTGSVKLVRGLVAQEKKVNVISNVGDNYWLYGLYVCPDIDTIIYGLADLLDQELYDAINDECKAAFEHIPFVMFSSVSQLGVTALKDALWHLLND